MLLNFYYFIEITVLLRKYSQVVQRYYVQYLVGYDSIILTQSIQSIYANQQHTQDPSFIILQSIVNTISALSVKQGICIYKLYISKLRYQNLLFIKDLFY